MSERIEESLQLGLGVLAHFWCTKNEDTDLIVPLPKRTDKLRGTRNS
jgi:hypothetical protein